jgi:hypothetical protein
VAAVTRDTINRSTGNYIRLLSEAPVGSTLFSDTAVTAAIPAATAAVKTQDEKNNCSIQ